VKGKVTGGTGNINRTEVFLTEENDYTPSLLFCFKEELMLTLHFSQQDIDELNYQRFHHPDPMVMKRCDTVYLRAKGLKTGQIQQLTGRNGKTIRAHAD
jgi:hypothetical protein